MEHVGRPGDAAVIGDRLEGLQLREIHDRPLSPKYQFRGSGANHT